MEYWSALVTPNAERRTPWVFLDARLGMRLVKRAFTR